MALSQAVDIVDEKVGDLGARRPVSATVSLPIWVKRRQSPVPLPPVPPWDGSAAAVNAVRANHRARTRVACRQTPAGVSSRISMKPLAASG
jgi:hypothetical protein